MIETVFIA